MRSPIAASPDSLRCFLKGNSLAYVHPNGLCTEGSMGEPVLPAGASLMKPKVRTPSCPLAVYSAVASQASSVPRQEQLLGIASA